MKNCREVMLDDHLQNFDILESQESVNLQNRPTGQPSPFLVELRPSRRLLLFLKQLLAFFVSFRVNLVKLSANKMSANSKKFWLIIYLLHFNLKFLGKYLNFESNSCVNISQLA